MPWQVPEKRGEHPTSYTAGSMQHTGGWHGQQREPEVALEFLASSKSEKAHRDFEEGKARGKVIVIMMNG